MLSTIHGINQWSCTTIIAGHFITFLLNLGLLFDCYLLFTSCKADVNVFLCISFDYCLDGLKGVFGQSECFLGTNLRCFDGTLAEGNKLYSDPAFNYCPDFLLMTVCSSAQEAFLLVLSLRIPSLMSRKHHGVK